MAQQVKVPSVKPSDPSSIPRTCVAEHNQLMKAVCWPRHAHILTYTTNESIKCKNKKNQRNQTQNSKEIWSLSWWHVPELSALWQQEDQQFRITLGYVRSSEPVWAMWDPAQGNFIEWVEWGLENGSIWETLSVFIAHGYLKFFVSCNLQVFASVTKDIKEGERNSSPPLKS